MATYAISDIHGNWKRYKAFRRTLGFDDRVFVLGDVIDKGKDGIDILVDMINDGRFIILMGNHEHLMHSYLKAARNGDWGVASCYEDLWLSANGGNDTYGQYCSLSSHLKAQIDGLFENMPVIIPDVIVNGRHFCLVHSAPDRHNGGKILNDERIVIAGHAAMLRHGRPGEIRFNADRIEDATYIDIDGGCAYGSKGTSLIALRLDDLTPFYFSD